MQRVYVIRGKGTDRYKLGISVAPLARLHALQTGSPVELELVAQFQTDDAVGDEQRLHRWLRQFKWRSEWFTLPPPVAHALLEGTWDVLQRQEDGNVLVCCSCDSCIETAEQPSVISTS